MAQSHLIRCLILLLLVGLAVPAFAADNYEPQIRALVTRFCADCHDAKSDHEFKADLLADRQRVQGDYRLMTKLVSMLRTGKMPPKDADQPSAAERERIIHWAESVRAKSPAAGHDTQNPGRVVMRRLSRYEYANTVRDLFGYGRKTGWKYFVAPGEPFPEQGIEYSRRTYNLPWNLPPDEVDYGFDNIGEVLTLPPHLLESYFEVAGLVVDRVIADQMPDRTTPGKARPKALPVRPSASKSETDAARENLASLAMRVFRRPVTAAEVDPLVALFSLARKNEATFDEGMKIPLRALLVSPDFLFHAERIPAASPAATRPLNDYELASRLSYFLWSSMPDAELFELAAQKKLSDPAEIERQVRRMLRDPKAEALAEHFAPQWLQIEDIQTAMPDPMLFAPFYQRFLGGAMRTEAIIFFDSVIVRDRSILDLVNSETSFMNAKLAQYYGLIKKAPNKYDGFAFWREYPLPPGRQSGVITMAAVATMTSTPTRSSPVKRGKWVLEAILGDPPPPPPPNVEPLKEKQDGDTPVTFREKLEQHRASANCAACHQAMDPLGLALENLDAIGRWRETDDAGRIDASGTLKDGATITGAAGLTAEILAHRRDEFARCLAEHMLVYALGRKREWYDQAAVARIVDNLRADDYRFSTLMVEVATSRPFRYTTTSP